MGHPRTVKIAAIDDEPEICWLITRILEEEGYQPLVADNGPEGLDLIRREHPELLLLDLRLPGMDGLEVLRRVREFDQEMLVIILSAFESFEAAVQAMKLGSYDFLTKPINIEEMKITLKNALQTRALVRQVRALKRQVEESHEARRMIGASPAMQELERQVRLAGQHNISVLILGESGTGKELLARAVHYGSGRRGEAFVPIDCAAIPEALIESELFGHERGAFTGAAERKPGRLELAAGGTVFLDEIGNIPLGIQAKLLRVLQERRITRLGGKTSVPLDIRLIAATNQDLSAGIAAGWFREDLFYRLNEFPLRLPPLRERGEDIQLLAQYFLNRFNQEFGRQVKDITAEARRALQAYPWPGNIRELQGAIKRAVILSADEIGLEQLPGEIATAIPSPAVAWRPMDDDEIRPIKEVSREVVARIEEELIRRALTRSGGNKLKTARWLGIDYKTLFNKLKQYRIRTGEAAADGTMEEHPAADGTATEAARS